MQVRIYDFEPGRPPAYIQSAGRADRREPWLRVFQECIAPQLADAELAFLRVGLLADDPRILQGHTTQPPPLWCVQDWPCEGACPLGFTAFASNPEPTIAEAECRFAKLCRAVRPEDGDSHSFLSWVDDTPRMEMRLNLAAAIDGVLERRAAEERANAELYALSVADEVCHCGQDYADHVSGAAGEHSFSPM